MSLVFTFGPRPQLKLNNFSLEGLMHWRSHLCPRDHNHAPAITSCPGPDLASWMYMHWRSHSSGTQYVQSFAAPSTRHECDLRCMYIQLARSGTGQDVIAGVSMSSQGRKCYRQCVRTSRLNLKTYYFTLTIH